MLIKGIQRFFNLFAYYIEQYDFMLVILAALFSFSVIALTLYKFVKMKLRS